MKYKNIKKSFIIWLFVLLFSVFIFSSCNQNIPKNEINNNSIVEKNEINNNSIVDINIKKLKKYEISENDKAMLNNLINSILVRNVISDAIKNNNLKLCNELDNNFINECKEKVIISNSEENIESCKQLWNSWAILNCTNNFYKNIAYNKLNESFCKKIIDNSFEKFLVNSCLNDILIKRAVKNLDYNICNKILNTDVISVCKKLVKGEIDIK